MKDPLKQLTIKNEPVEIVSTYKYLGITVDDQLNWQAHSALTFKKMNQRLFLLRKLRSFNIDTKILSLFYKSCIESVLLFCLMSYGGNCNAKDKNKFDSLIRKACKISGNPFECFDSLLEHICVKKIKSINQDITHPLYPQVMTSPRSGRPILPKVRLERYRNNFIPFALKLLSLLFQR